MYLGGQGGTGKSRVIDALRDFFVDMGQSRRFRLLSYTGVAARNISGMTLHAALMLGDGLARSAKAKKDLMAMWEGVDYLFIDEISMVGCAFLSSWLLGLDWETPLCQRDSILKFLVRLAKNRLKD
jgi:hypothetical protein